MNLALLADDRGARGRRVPRRGGDRPERRRWRSPPASRSTAACWSTSGCARWTTTILAAGDVAEHAGRVHGLWPVAVEQAEVAADNAVGGDKEYRGSIPFTMLKVVGVELTSVGRFEEQAGDEVVALEEPGGKYRKLVIEDGRIVGAILLGYSQEVAAVRTAINRGFHVGGVMDALRAGRWERAGRAVGRAPAARGRADRGGLRRYARSASRSALDPAPAVAGGWAGP